MISTARALLITTLLIRAGAAQTAEELAQTAARAMQQQDYAAAENAYHKLLQLSPDVAEVYSNLGLACYSQKRLPCAEEALTHALKLAPDLFVPNFLLGEIRFQQGTASGIIQGNGTLMAAANGSAWLAFETNP